MPRAGLGCDADLRVRSDGPLRLTLAGCDQVVRVGAGASRRGCVSRRRFAIHPPRRLRGRRVVASRVFVSAKRVRVRGRKRPRAVVDLRGRRSGRFTVRIVSRLATGRRVTTRRAYRTCARRRT